MANQTTPAIQVKDSNVGIGTTSPAEKLQVAGNATVHPGQKFGWIYNPGTDNNMYNFIQTAADGSGVAASALEISGSRWTNGNTAGVIFTHQTGGQIMTIMTGGNVGIGATAPVSKLQVNHSAEPSFNPNGGSNALTLIKTTGSGAPGTFGAGLVFSQPYFTNDAAIGVGGIYGVKSAGDGAFGGGIAFFTQPSGAGNMFEVFRYIDNGNVGIGTTSPTAKLQVVLPANTTSSIFQSTASEALLNIQTFPTTNRMQLLVGDYNGTSTPNIAAISDSNTGIQWAGSDILRFVNGGSENVTINASGNVGIGTTSPISKLNVVGSHTGGYGIVTVVSTDSAFISIDSQVSDGGLRLKYNTTDQWLVGIRGGDTFHISNASDQYKLSILQSGNVGIGTTSPNNTLEVAGSLGSGKSTIRITNTDTGNYATIIAGLPGTTNAGMSFATDGTSKMVIDASGEVGIGTVLPMGPLEVYKANTGGLGGHIILNNNGMAVGNETAVLFNDSGVGSLSSVRAAISSSVEGSPYYGDLKFKTGATSYGSLNTRMIITGAGNVGIGTTSPQSLLHAAKAGNTNGGTILMGLGGSGTDKWSFLAGTHYNQATGSGNGTGSAGVALIGAYTTEIANAVYVGGGPYEINPATQITFWTYTSTTHDLGGTEKMRITSAGNVGIGTTSPGEKLEVNGVAKASGFISGNFTASTQGFSIEGGDSSVTTYRFDSDRFRFFSGNFGEIVTIQESGNVGIGTTSPGAKLEIAGTNSAIALSFGNSVPNNPLFINTYGGFTGIGMDQTTAGLRLAGDSGGNNLVDIGYYSSNVVAHANWVSRMRVLGNGNVGIGTTSPSEKLHVDGNVIVTYNNSFQGINSIGNKAILARVSPTTGIINYAEYATATNLNGFVLGSDDARVKGDIATDSLDFVTNTSSRMFINSSGNVGIATTSPSYKLDVVGDSRITSGSLGVGVAPNATDGRIDASNDIVAYSTSDQRLKENVTPIENALEKVKTLTGVEFDWKEETAHVHGYHGHDVGIIAQDVQAVLPEAVRTNESGYLSVRYEKMIALLIEANKELAARVELLEQKLKQ
jgi:hypothetical protein